MTEIAPQREAELCIRSGRSARSLAAQWLAGFTSERTIIGYRNGLTQFAAHLGIQPEEAVSSFLSATEADANLVVDAYRAAMIQGPLQPATVNVRLAALRSLVGWLKRRKLIDYRLDVSGVRSKAYRDVRGPGDDGMQKIMQAAREIENPMAQARALAVVALLYGAGLRAAEVYALNVGDVNLDAGGVSIVGKGRTEKEIVPIGEHIVAALKYWLSRRAATSDRDALFIGLSGRSNERPHYSTIGRIVKDLSKRSGVTVTPHALRHGAATSIAGSTKDIQAVRNFLRHRNIATSQIYIDAAEDLRAKLSDDLMGALRR